MLGRLWNLIPTPARLWVILGLVGLGLAALGVVIYKLEQHGYNRCETSYAEARSTAKDESRAKIIPTEKKYEQIKSNIVRESGPNTSVGPRVSLAIDSLPSAPGDSR